MLDEYLQQVTRYVESGGKEGIGRLIVEMPPRHGKTLTVSRLYPTWHLGRNPDHRVMLVSYGATLAFRNSRAARNLVRLPAYQETFPGVQLARDSSSVESWSLEGYEGGMDALGIGGGATGKGAHLLIIDDPIKNREEAESEVIREKVWDAWQDDLETRLEPGGAVIVMMTRWHVDDLIGRLLSHRPNDWTRLRLPALAEEGDVLGRAVGEPLWPWRYPRERLEEIRSSRTVYSWVSLYQQRPAPREGGLFKYEVIHRHRRQAPPQLKRIVVAIDPAMSSKRSSDETGVVVAGVGYDGHGYVLDDASGRYTPKEWADVAIDLYRQYEADRIVGEVNNGGDLVEMNIRSVDPHVSYKPVRASRGKAVRAEPVASLYEQGKVHHVGKFEEMEEQMCTWSEGDASPDRMDALVWALTELMLGGADPHTVYTF